jgi:predicted PhzF superfamily epimerase YddE/YHI9
MQGFTDWTRLSEASFLLPPTGSTTRGSLRLQRAHGQVWIGGDSVTCIAGTVTL